MRAKSDQQTIFFAQGEQRRLRQAPLIERAPLIEPQRSLEQFRVVADETERLFKLELAVDKRVELVPAPERERDRRLGLGLCVRERVLKRRVRAEDGAVSRVRGEEKDVLLRRGGEQLSRTGSSPVSARNNSRSASFRLIAAVRVWP